MKKISILAVATTMVAASVFGQNSNANSHAFAASMAHFNANAKAYGLTDPTHELKARNSFVDQLGQTHIRFDQSVNGVKVFEGEAISHVDRADRVTVTNALRGNLNVDTTPSIAEATAVSKAVNAIAPRGGANTSAELIVLPAGQRSATTRLAWHVTVETDNEIDAYSKTEFFIDAKSGDKVWSFDATETARPGGGGTGTAVVATPATANTAWSGAQQIAANNPSAGVFTMQDTTRGVGSATSGLGNATYDLGGRSSGTGTLIQRSTAVFGDGSRTNTDSATAGADAHYGLQKTWDYYKTIHGRNGIDNAGSKTYSRVHYGRNYENAFWSDSCFCMTYGDGATSFYTLTSLDVSGHEMSHGVTARSANLTYSGESGGLNESFSDIGGTNVEFFANNTNTDTTTCTAGNNDCPEYWIGERIMRSNWATGSYVESKALRYMDDPRKDGRSPACWSSSVGGLDVHYSSGPENHAYYLASHGGTSACNGSNVAGIGNVKASKIWYRALTVYMTSSTSYAGARAACLNAATDLYGAGSAEYNAVAAAYAGINVN